MLEALLKVGEGASGLCEDSQSGCSDSAATNVPAAPGKAFPAQTQLPDLTVGMPKDSA